MKLKMNTRETVAFIVLILAIVFLIIAFSPHHNPGSQTDTTEASALRARNDSLLRQLREFHSIDTATSDKTKDSKRSTDTMATRRLTGKPSASSKSRQPYNRQPTARRHLDESAQ